MFLLGHTRTCLELHHNMQRKFAPERIKAINDEVDRLLEIGAIEECFYLDWLCNPVVVPKKSEKLRICIDFTHLNKTCPKDSYPLPRIDQMVDATTGYNQISFLDAYSCYNQIPMNPENLIHIAFVT